ncbi:hypothetical protein [Bradyrhizobium sp. HKCCYLRH1065]|uniref:hypothetical protein n=1 Tax=unclassified Bradyrhizobium TaxID=2631580 RepID=UPI003EBCCC75
MSAIRPHYRRCKTQVSIRQSSSPCASAFKRWLSRFSLLMFVLAAAVSSRALAQNVSDLYSEAELQAIGSRYRPRLRATWEDDFLARLTRDERERAGTVTLNLPLIGDNGHPLDFYSVPERREVSLPVSSVKFVDDLSIAFAYYGKYGCNIGLVSDYAAALRFQPQHAKGSPLDVLGVPRTAINDQDVDDVAQKILKSILFFLTVHEYAHVMYHHKPYGAITAQQAQQQEIEADSFALSIMQRIAVPPVSLTYLFLVSSRLEDTPGDYESASAYEQYLRERATHPVSSLRLFKVAEIIQSNARAFARLQHDTVAWENRLQEMASQLQTIASGLDDREMRKLLRQQAEKLDVASLRLACKH